MSDKFQPIEMEQLTGWVFSELEARGSIFGIPRELFFVPAARNPLATPLYGRTIETPFGVAAGPHTQMAQNIIAAWLCGARFIELKTVQTLDELEVSKPCIDMQDEGYNVEWSQELKVRQSFDEYVRAWVLIHALHRKLGLPGRAPGVLFNMSVGYNMEGILQPNMQEYLASMADAGERVTRYAKIVAARGGDAGDIPSRISDNVTLSTMHGCPPNEIEKISAYLIEEWGLHTSVKLNPTLLGPERLRTILNRDLGFTHITVPDIAFEHDLKYADAVPMLKRLGETAARKNVQFGVKLSNTLEVENRRKVFSPKEKMMYMSGRSLHAVTVNLAAKLAEEFGGRLMMSFSAGADAFNVARLLASGMKTITVCSDLLKPGSYSRLGQYIEEASAALGAGAAAGSTLETLKAYAQEVLKDPRYRKEAVDASRTKTGRALGPFDCIMAPCTDECPINQKVPRYMTRVREGRAGEAVDVTRDDNPMPSVLGRACNHRCENTCVRTHYDEPLAIREIKRFVMEQECERRFRRRAAARNVPVGVIGGGPCGLSVAYFLAQAGYPVTIFEARPYPGGMVAGSIPGYRATQAVIEQDLEVIRALGVDIRCNRKAGRDFTLADVRKEGFRYIVLAAGAQKGVRLGIEGEDAAGVLDGLDFLRSVREKKPPRIGQAVGVIGGGDVAMDCARTAARLTGGKVSVIYRRTMAEMPAQPEELHGLLEEGIPVVELLAPKAVVSAGGRMTALRCARMKLGEPDASGRRRPEEIRGSEFDLPLDTLIVAIGQAADLSFFGAEPVTTNRKGYIEVNPETLETSVPGVYAGGDVVLNGPETIVQAMGDGRRIAESIRRREEGSVPPRDGNAFPAEVNIVELLRKKARRQYRVPIPHTAPQGRRNFDEIVETLSEADARREAARCLDCHLLCSLCVGVCPNLAFFTYRVKPFEARLPVLRLEGGRLTEAGREAFAVRQGLQVAVLTDFCNECGNCATFCPTAGRPYQDKPRLYLREAEFAAESDNAHRILKRGGAWAMQARCGGVTHEIELGSDLRYTAPGVRIVLDPATFEVRDAAVTGGSQPGEAVSLKTCAQMFVLLSGIRDSMPHLPTAGS